MVKRRGGSGLVTLRVGPYTLQLQADKATAIHKTLLRATDKNAKDIHLNRGARAESSFGTLMDEFDCAAKDAISAMVTLPPLSLVFASLRFQSFPFPSCCFL